MPFVKSLDDSRPPGRFDSLPWTKAIFQEAPDSSGAPGTWTTRSTITIATGVAVPASSGGITPTGNDTTPASPLTRDLTTNAATIETGGWYRILWEDAAASQAPGPAVRDTSAATGTFISVTELGDYLGRNLASDNGALMCVEAACEMCRDVAEQKFTQQLGETITLDGSGTDALLLPELPATTAGTVAVFELEGTTNTWNTIGTADYTLNDNGVLLATNRAGTATLGRQWPSGRQNVRVTYDHGYTSANMPDSVRQVALSVASRLLVQGPAIAESLGDVNIRYAAESTALMPTERMILTKHRRRK